MIHTFTTKARTVELLGRNQIRDGITAINELVKNAYDADSDWVEIHFGTGQSTNDAVVIMDRGCGMSYDEFVGNWLVIGTTGKRSRDKTPGGRPLLGAKGVGRLAADALGSELLLFTRAENSPWVIAYLNWRIFENPHLFLDQIRIPLLIADTIDRRRLQPLLDELRQIQMRNLELDGWFETSTDPPLDGLGEVECFLEEQHGRLQPSLDLARLHTFRADVAEAYKDIYSNINNLNPNVKLITELAGAICSKGRGTGTVLYMTSLRSDWDFDVEANTPTLNSLSRTMSWLFNAPDIGMEARVYYNGYHDLRPKFEKDFDEHHYNIYDIKFSGEIRMDADEIARFYGQLFVRGIADERLEPVNRILANGLPVMDYLAGKTYKDCGPFRIEVCHVEGDQWRSNLTQEEWQEITALTSDEDGLRKGGIRVFRDDVRVLPYGDVGNDFLGIEYRRTRKAGRWIFSHRNTFGRIMLTREQNGNLQEKTSREGFIEDEYYCYFQNTCAELLEKMASQFLNEESEYNLRNLYVEKKDQALRERQAAEQMRREERKKLRAQMAAYSSKMDQFDADDLLSEIGYARTISDAESLPDDASPSVINRIVIDLRNVQARIEALRELTIQPPAQLLLSGGVRFRKRVEMHNQSIDDICSVALPRLDRAINTLNNRLDTLTARYAPDIEFINQTLDDYHAQLTSARDQLDKLASVFTDQARSFDEIYDRSRQRVRELTAPAGLICRIDAMDNDLRRLRKQAVSDYDLPGVSARLRALRAEIEAIGRDAACHCSEALQRFNETMHSIPPDYARQLNKSSLEQNSRLLMEQASEADDLLELANIGLASDVLTHEFAQYLGMIDDAIGSIREFKLDAYGKHWVGVLDSGVKALSARLSALMPMHKSRHSYREPIDLQQQITAICQLFERRWSRNGITLQCDIPDGVIVQTSLSRFFPAVCNILDNMSHWVLLNRESRVISIRYEDGALSFSNSGPGIRAETEPLLFTPFFTTREGGRGLGLYLSRTSLRALEWDLVLTIREDPEHLGGPVFSILIPEKDRGG